MVKLYGTKQFKELSDLSVSNVECLSKFGKVFIDMNSLQSSAICSQTLI